MNSRGTAPRASSSVSPSEELEAQVAAVIGDQIRIRRLELGLSIDALAERSDLSKGMLSKIENKAVSPSLSTLARLSTALDIPFTSFFRGLSEEREAVFVKAGHGAEITRQGTRAGHRYTHLGGGRGPLRHVEPLLVSLTEPTEVFPIFQHPGVEMLYMLEGVMEYGHGAGRYTMEPGDLLKFEGEISHGPTELLQLPIKFLSVTVKSVAKKG